MNFLEGQILAFDKPYRATSFRMVAHVRRLLTKRLGRRLKVYSQRQQVSCYL